MGATAPGFPDWDRDRERSVRMVGSPVEALPGGEPHQPGARANGDLFSADAPVGLQAGFDAVVEEAAAPREERRASGPAFRRFQEFYASRDPHLRSELILEHLALAQSIARRFTWPGLAPDDLLQIARVGLIHAVDRFDPRRGVTFATFATRTI